MSRRSEGTEETVEALWAMGAVLAMVTTMITGVFLYVTVVPPTPDSVLVGPGLLVPFAVAAVVALGLLAGHRTIIPDPGPQSGGPDKA